MFKFPPKEGSMTWMGCCSIRKDKALSSLFFFLLLLLLLSLFLLPKPLPVLKVFYTRKRQKLLGAREKKGARTRHSLQRQDPRPKWPVNFLLTVESRLD